MEIKITQFRDGFLLNLRVPVPQDINPFPPERVTEKHGLKLFKPFSGHKLAKKGEVPKTLFTR